MSAQGAALSSSASRAASTGASFERTQTVAVERDDGSVAGILGPGAGSSTHRAASFTSFQGGRRSFPALHLECPDSFVRMLCIARSDAVAWP